MTDSENIMRKVAKDFAESEIEPKVEIMEQTGEFPVELLKTMARIGITGIITPQGIIKPEKSEILKLLKTF